MDKKKEKRGFVKLPFKVMNIFVKSLLKAVFVDFAYNLKSESLAVFRPEKAKRLNRDVRDQKMAELMQERLEILERLTWAMHNDAEYLRSNKGRSDMHDLKKSVK